MQSNSFPQAARSMVACAPWLYRGRAFSLLAITSFLLVFPLANAFSQLVSPPSPGNDISPAADTDVSSTIASGSGYDGWTGSVHRTVLDLEVPGATSDHGLKWERTYNSGGPYGWTYSYQWYVYGRPFSTAGVAFPDGRFGPLGVGNKARVFKFGMGQTSGHYDLWLEDGSKVYFDVWTDLNYSGQALDGKQEDSNIVDYVTPLYLLDPHGRRTDFAYEQWGWQPDRIRLAKVIDPSGRWLKISYSNPAYGTAGHSATAGRGYVTRVDASNGDYVTYDADGDVHYSDGTIARYKYGSTTYMTYYGRVTKSKLILAQDVRAKNAMQSVQFDYAVDGNFEGQVRSERYYKPVLAADGSLVAPAAPGVAVSTFTSNSWPPFHYTGYVNSDYADGTGATQTETRGDGPSRALYFQAANKVPLLRSKTDFDGVKEQYRYNGSNFFNSVTDRNGNITDYQLTEALGNPLRVTYPLTPPDTVRKYVEYTYTSNSNPYYVWTRTDENSKTTTYTRDPVTHLITRINYPDGAVETFDYNTAGQVIRQKRKNDAFVHVDYDAKRRVVRISNPTTSATAPAVTAAGIWTKYTYFEATDIWQWQDRVRTATDPLGHTTTYWYDVDSAGVQRPGRGLVSKIRHEVDGTYQTFGYDDFGNKIWEENELRERTSYAYDEYNRLTSTSVAAPKPQPGATPFPGGLATTTLNYTATNGASSYSHTTKSVRKKTSPSGVVSGQTFDNNFRVATKIDGEGSGIGATTRYDYDANGNQITVTDPRGAYLGNPDHTTTAVYDKRNRKTSSKDPLQQTTRWAYDPVGNVLTLTRADTTTELKTYDPLNRVKTIKDPMGRITTLSYNLSGTLASVLDANNHTTSFQYNAADLKTEMRYHNGDYQAFDYDADNQLKWRRIASGRYQKFQYDGRHRKKTMWWSTNNDMSDTTDFVWPNSVGVDRSSFLYDAASRLTTAQNNWSTVTRTYDAAGRLESDTQLVDGTVNKTINYRYRLDGSLVRLYDAINAYDRLFGYDGMGRFEKIRNKSDNALWFQYSYDAASNETQRMSYLNNVAQVYTRDSINRLTQRDVKAGSTSKSLEAYGLDAMNRVLSIDRVEPGTATKRDLFDYNDNGELISGKYGIVGTGTPGRIVSYGLDDVGNRTNVTDNGVSRAYVPDNINRYTSVGGAAVTSTAAHAVASYSSVNYGYIGDTFLARVSNAANTYYLRYDALGRCVKRSLNGIVTYYIYDGDKPILEYKGDGATVAGWNVYGKGIDEILMRSDFVAAPGGQGYFYQQDRNGNVTHLTGWDGAVIEKYSYDAFGAPTTVTSQGSFNNRFKFTGREYVPAFGIYEYRNRAYHPGLGRFMSEDPKGFDAGDYNLFRYCHNDPNDFTDPLGLARMPYLGFSPIEGDWARYGSYINAARSRGYSAAAAAKPSSKGAKAGSSRDPKKVRAGYYKFATANDKLQKAIDAVFGADASKIPRQTLENAPRLDPSLSEKEIGRMSTAGESGATAVGDPEAGPNGTIYISRESFNARGDNAVTSIYGSYTHELGNILDANLNGTSGPRGYMMNYGDPRSPVDKDTGAALETKMFGGLQY